MNSGVTKTCVLTLTLSTFFVTLVKLLNLSELQVSSLEKLRIIPHRIQYLVPNCLENINYPLSGHKNLHLRIMFENIILIKSLNRKGLKIKEPEFGISSF